MANPLLAVSNRIGDTTIATSCTLADGTYSVTRDNMKDAKLVKIARTTTSRRLHTRVRGAFDTNYSIRAFVMAYHNLSATARVRLRAGRASLDLLFDDEESDILDSRLTKSGGTNGTRVNARGFIVPVTATNHCLQSQTLDNASWTKTNVTVSADAVTAPDATGTTTAERIASSTTNGEHSISQTITTVAGHTYTTSVHVRGGNTAAASYDWVALEFDGVGTAWFNVKTGKFGTTSGTLVDKYVRYAGAANSGSYAPIWYRFQITVTAADTSSVVKLHVVNADGVTSYAGSASRGVYAWGFQVEEGGDSTPYIATTSATVTATTSGRINHSPINLASGVATQTLSNVTAGDYTLVVGGGPDVSVVASGTVLYEGQSVTCSGWRLTTVRVTSIGTVTLTVTGTPTAIHFRECYGLMVEEARTNASTYSSEFDNAAWTKAGVTITANAVAAPDGTQTADYAVETATTGEHTVYKASIASQTTHAKSFFIKAGGRSAASVRFFNSSSSEYLTVTFSLLNGTVTQTTNSGGIFSSVASSCEAWGNGWFRCSVSATRASGTTYYTVDVNSSTTPTLNTSGCEEFAGDTSKGIYLWGSQLEAGSFPTSYIPTTSAAVTRAADSETFSIAPTKGVIYVEAVPSALNAVNNEILRLHDGTTNNAIGLVVDSSGSARFEVTTGGVDQAVITGAAVSVGQKIKLAGAFNTNDFAFAYPGGAGLATDSAGTVPTVTTARIGNRSDGARPFNGHVKRVTVFTEDRATNADMNTLTTSGPDALGFNSGWFDAQEMTFFGEDTDWGLQYPVMRDFGEDVEVNSFTLEIDDVANEDGYVSIGRLGMFSMSFQPEIGPAAGWKDGREDLSTRLEMTNGRIVGTSRRRRRVTSFLLEALSLEEGNKVHELMDVAGTLEEVLYIPDPDDMETSQRLGGLCHLRSLQPVDYPFLALRSAPFELIEKL